MMIIAVKDLSLIEQQLEIIKGLDRIKDLEVVEKAEKPKQSLVFVVQGIEVHLLTEGLIDLDQEKKRLQQEIQQAENFITSLNKKLANKEFVDKAPQEVIDKEKTKLADQQEKVTKLKEQLQTLS